MACLQNLQRIIVARDISPSSFKLKKGIIPLLTKYVSYGKTTCHIKLKFFLWTKLLENLLLAKYQALAYETYNCTRTPLHMPKTRDACKKKHALFD